MFKVISGGQTGIDQMGLEVAMAAGLETGGTAAKGWMTEKGPMEELLRSYGLKECDKPGYPARTWQNILDSDAAVWFGSGDTTGYYRTKADCKRAGRAFIDNPTAEQLLALLIDRKVKVLNVAGNRASKLNDKAERLATMTLYTVFLAIKKRLNESTKS